MCLFIENLLAATSHDMELQSSFGYKTAEYESGFDILVKTFFLRFQLSSPKDTQ